MRKKTSNLILPLLAMGVFLIFASSCKKEDAGKPVLKTLAVTEITDTTAKSGGNITSDGGAAIIARGVCWSTRRTPTITDNKTTDGTGAGDFESSIVGLSANTTYYVRAYATNSNGTVYGNEISFNTELILTTLAVTEITGTTAKSGGNISSDGGATITARGVCWSTSRTPTISDNKTTDGTGAGDFESSIVGLSANTTYYVRAYATSSNGTVYGNEISFTTGLSIGSFYAGGIVFYNDGTGHGLVCAESDQSIGEGWGCTLTFIGGTSTAINTGEASTNVILAGCTETYIAARLCYDLSLNGYTDWFLPSRDELVLMYTNLHTQGLGNFEETEYWSSSEYNFMLAWRVNFDNGNTDMDSKDGINRVRAIRAF